MGFARKVANGVLFMGAGVIVEDAGVISGEEPATFEGQYPP
jgi:ABC-type polar amino acid transport system ATPase subunit